jgi:hypothetical protein
MTTKLATVSVRLPASLKSAVTKLAAAGGISVSQFLASAAAEKLSAMQTAEAFFAERKGRGDKDAAIRFLKREGGESPRLGDELPAAETAGG